MINDTEVLKYVCTLKRRDIYYELSREVIESAQPIADGNNLVCRLCLKETTAVVYALNKNGCLNKRNEFIFSCGHIKKGLCQNCTSGQNCTKTFLHGYKFARADKIARRHICTAVKFAQGFKFARVRVKN